VKSPALRKRVHDEILHAALNDNRKAWFLGPGGEYVPVRPAAGQPVLRSQSWLIEKERAAAAGTRETRSSPLFAIPDPTDRPPARRQPASTRWKPASSSPRRRPTRKGQG
jgi:hypothetical protein